MQNITSAGYEDTSTSNVKPIVLTIACIIFVGAFLYYFYATPGTKIGPEQPIPFSHRLHVKMNRSGFSYLSPSSPHTNDPAALSSLVLPDPDSPLRTTEMSPMENINTAAILV